MAASLLAFSLGAPSFGAPGSAAPAVRLRLPRLAPLLAFLTILGLSACGGDLLGDDPTTGLELQVTKSPIEPVERPGEQNWAPVSDAVVEVRAEAGGSLRTTTDAAGLARLQLAPGGYTAEVLECPGTLGLPAPASVEVEPGAFASLRLDCDTGIR